jgi:hypothetical protein
MINVYMDDLRPCPKGFVLTRSVNRCKKILSSKRIHTLSLDHDMGFGKPTGFDLVKYMVKHKLFAKKIIIHSANPFGRYRMVQLLKQHLPSQIELSVMPEPIYLKI